ncbi:MAG: YajQ family cyclic di-GMP-binding protein [Ignavibacteriae bacterium]|nr:YajQ family cyclic di-GMP-binding protein [Ignavibacteriota bacterium]MCB9206969.1 YajQ family cyclic di-GMP-binding protein [Ignavibacteriales bacterium]MCB9210479.1 YajQ family cyclic di-GMP-binding protein [Ignavibacteriales bacterium]MCB9219710.1 YajQ family cyclic di-GMP-binding protein [Ignavibacteriales bacterium]
MAQKFSFDVVSEVDYQEIDNAVNQAIKEITQRYDLKDSKTTIDLNKNDKLISINSKDDYGIKTSVDILQSKFIKRQISLKVMRPKEIEPAANGRVKQNIDLQSGISKENAKLITKMIKDLKLKINAQIMDEQVRVQGQKKDELQQVITMLKEAELDFPVQFTNYK